MLQSSVVLFIRCVAFSILVGLASESFAATLHVNATVSSSGSGATWLSELKTLQEALQVTGGPHTIKIAEGTYYVDQGLSGAATREDTFFIEAGTVILAGYPPSGDPADTDRNPLRYPVILSGDIDRSVSGETDDYSSTTGFAGGNYDTLSGNVLHVIVIDDEADGGTELQGVTVQGGNADGEYADGNGGGIYCGDGYAFIRNCVVRWNRAKVTNVPPGSEEFYLPADGLGGGIFWQGDVGQLTIRDTKFEQNHAYWGGGLYVYSTESTNPENSVLLVGCRFQDNLAKALAGEGRARGGGAALEHGIGAIDIVSCDFVQNMADGVDGLTAGGAAALQMGLPIIEGVCEEDCEACHECSEECLVLSDPCSSMACESCPTNVNITNTVFRANRGRNLAGGAIRLNRKTTFNHCVFVANETESTDGGAVMILGHGAFVQFNSCIIWDNQVPSSSGASELAQQVLISIGSFDAAHSVIQGLSDPQFPSSPSPDPLSPGNIEEDPEFVLDPHPGADGQWGTSDDQLGDLRLSPDSPCIDEGDDGLLPPDVADIDESSSTSEDLPLDLPYRPRSVDGECGGGNPAVDMGAYEYWCFGDLNGDCAVNGMDSALLLAAWNTAGYFPCPLYELEDLDRNCKIDGRDLSLLLNAWGDCPEVGGGESAAPLGGGEGSSEDEVFAMLWQWYVEENWAALLEWALSQLP